MSNRSAFLARLSLALLAGGLLLMSLRLPLWHMRMEAPQYQGPEALKIVVRPGAMEGNLGEIKVLNHYIGLKIPDTLPQNRWLPAMLCVGAGLGLAATLLPSRFRRIAAPVVAALLAGGMCVAAAQAQFQMYRIGHDRDQHAVLRHIKDFTPPLLGSRKLAQFEISSGLGLGSICVTGAVVLYGAVGWMAQRKLAASRRPVARIPNVAHDCGNPGAVLV